MTTDMIDRLGVRSVTMREALHQWLARGGETIVETGCVRQADDWLGAGMSTVVFADYITQHGGYLSSIDNDPAHIDLARSLVGEADVIFEEGDSVEILRNWGSEIDLLYLDSLDYPLGALLDIYGGKDDLSAAKVALWALSDAEIIARHGPIIAACQEHCADEVRAALPWAKSLILIDDAALPGGGKARLARVVLAAAGFKEIASGYQSLWSR